MDKQNAVYIHNRTVFGLKKERIFFERERERERKREHVHVSKGQRETKR